MAQNNTDSEQRTPRPRVSWPGFEPKLSPRFLNYVRQYLLDHDLPLEPCFENCDQASRAHNDNDPPLPVAQVCELFERTAQATGNQYLGLDVAAGYHYEASAMLILAFMAAPTVGVALETLAHYDKYVDSAIEINLSRAGGLHCFEFNLLAPEGTPNEQLLEYLGGFIASALQRATCEAVPIERMAFTHVPKKNRAPLDAFFNVNVVCGARRNAMHFDERYLEQPLETANELLFDVLCGALARYYGHEGSHYDFVQTVYREVLIQFRTGTPTAQSTAAGLKLSARSLRRRLAAHGKTLQAVKNEARLQRAEFLLIQTPLPITDIAYELGFSEPSAFSRAFRDWTGESPQGHRERLRGAAASA